MKFLGSGNFELCDLLRNQIVSQSDSEVCETLVVFQRGVSRMETLEFDGLLNFSLRAAAMLVNFSPIFFELVRAVCAAIGFSICLHISAHFGRNQGVFGWPGHQVWIRVILLSQYLGFVDSFLDICFMDFSDLTSA